MSCPYILQGKWSARTSGFRLPALCNLHWIGRWWHFPWTDSKSGAGRWIWTTATTTRSKKEETTVLADAVSSSRQLVRCSDISQTGARMIRDFLGKFQDLRFSSQVVGFRTLLREEFFGGLGVWGQGPCEVQGVRKLTSKVVMERLQLWFRQRFHRSTRIPQRADRLTGVGKGRLFRSFPCRAWQHLDGNPSKLPYISMIEGPDSLRSPQTDSLRSRPQETHLEHHFSTHLGHHRLHFCEGVVTGGHSLRSPNQTYYKPSGLDMGRFTWCFGSCDPNILRGWFLNPAKTQQGHSTQFWTPLRLELHAMTKPFWKRTCHVPISRKENIPQEPLPSS